MKHQVDFLELLQIDYEKYPVIAVVGGGGVALDHQRIEGVDTGLNEQVCDGEDGILETSRKTQTEDVLCHGRGKTDGLEIQRVAVLHLCQSVKNESGGNALAQRACQSDACNIQSADDDEKQVEEDVQNTGDGQIHQRLFRLTDGTEHRVAKIVKREGRHTEEVDTQV